MASRKGAKRIFGLALAIALLTVAALAAATGIYLGVRGIAGIALYAQDSSSGSIATGVGIYTEATIAITIGILLLGVFSLQIGRNYFLRTLDKFTLRLGADMWWLTYVLARDGMAFGVVLAGFELFFVGTYGDYPIAVPFMPLAIVLIGFVLLLKLIRDPDEEPKTNRRISLLTMAATLSYAFGLLTVTESVAGYGSAGYLVNANGTIATASGGSDFWTIIYNTFSSTVNVQLALVTFYLCFAALSLLGMYALWYVMRIPPKAPGAKAPAGVASKPATRNEVVQAKAQ